MPKDADKSPQGGEKGGVSPAESDALLKKPAAKPAEPQEAQASGAVSEADIDALLAQATATPPSKQEEKPATFTLEDVHPQAAASEKPSVDMLMDVGLNVRVELGRRKMFIEDILRLSRGSVIELDKLAGDPLDILVNDKLVARGEVLVLNDNFCIRITNILTPGDKKE